MRFFEMKQLYWGFILLLLAGTAFARIDAADSFIITESSKTVSFSVTNTDTRNALPLTLTLAGPFASRINPFPDALSPGETKNFTATITTHAGLNDQTYRVSIVAKLGNTTETKAIELTFQELGPTSEDQNVDGTGFFGLGALPTPELPANLVDMALMVILALIVVAVLARLYKRIRTKKPSVEK